MIDRLKEPSSWAAIAALATTAGLNLDPGLVQSASYIMAGIAGLLGFWLKEKSTQPLKG